MPESLERKFGKILRELRSASNLSQQQLADLSNLDRTYISLWEHGLRSPTIKTVFKIAETLKMKPTEIIERLER